MLPLRRDGYGIGSKLSGTGNGRNRRSLTPAFSALAGGSVSNSNGEFRK
jgi:hypothetical protein